MAFWYMNKPNMINAQNIVSILEKTYTQIVKLDLVCNSVFPIYLVIYCNRTAQNGLRWASFFVFLFCHCYCRLRTTFVGFPSFNKHIGLNYLPSFYSNNSYCHNKQFKKSPCITCRAIGCVLVSCVSFHHLWNFLKHHFRHYSLRNRAENVGRFWRNLEVILANEPIDFTTWSYSIALHRM